LDAIPDLSDTQVIIYSRWDRSPDIIEDQVTYPIIASLLGAPRVKAVRGFSDFGFSYVYVIFQDGTDLYWARSRVLEYLSKIQPRLPEGVKTELGPDATGVGWVYQYALVDKSGRHSLAELRTFQDWTLRYWLQSVPGVAEVASIGGYQKQYQVNVEPNALAAYKIPISRVVEAVREGNNDVGGRLVEFSGAEYMVRGRGYAKSIDDLENIVIGRSATGTPILIRNVAHVSLGPDIRRGVADLDGLGDTVGGIVVMRQGENALNVIDRVKEKITEVAPGIPEGVEIVPVYDRSQLIKNAIHTLTHELKLQMLIVSLVILFFLWHIPSAIVPILTIPIAVFLSFIPMYFMGVTSNLMSLSGIAISIGVLVDGAIVEVENAYKRLEEWNEAGRPGDFHAVRLQALKEVGPSVFFSLLVIAIAFLPIFTLVDQEGRLFRPLAYTKNLAMAIAALLAITLDPAVRMLFTRMDFVNMRPAWLSWIINTVTVGKYYPEEQHPISRRLFRIYEPACRFVLRHRVKTIVAAVLLTLSAIPIYLKLGSEFMPPLFEGDLLYMPTTLPGISVTEAQKLMQTQDKILRSFPEVERVFGKAGRAETATDPAPFSMMETTVLLKPRNQWRKGVTKESLINEMDAALKLPGVTNAWTMPIKNRLDMLSTGIRTPVGIKVLGADLATVERIGVQLESFLRDVPGTRSVFAERAAGGYFLDFDIRRDQIARYGLSIKDVQMVIMTAIGGEPITTTIEGRERYTVNVRYPRELRDDIPSLRRVAVPTPSGANIPLAELADIRMKSGPSMIRDESGLLAGYVFIDTAESDVGGYVERAKHAVAENLKLPAGYSLVWSGQYENMIRVRQRLKIVVPLTLFLIFLLLFTNTHSIAKTLMVLLAVPFSLIGAVWLLYLLHYNVSIGVWVGMIALMGLDAETGVFMLLYLDLSYNEARTKGRLNSKSDLIEAIVHGAVKRVRPKMMTVCTALIGLLPILWSSRIGSDMMKRIAAPMVGGLITSFLLELLIYPPLYALWRERSLVRQKKSS
jgi:Cu(I)/Ag(I) efflux system membrane protein CusA/SilA